MNELKVGSKVWVFDENHREYDPAPPGARFAKGGPIYEKHWVEAEIVGETRASWVLNRYFGKFPKKRPALGGWHARTRDGFVKKVATTPQELSDDIWANSHRRHVLSLVERCNVTILREVAALVGYEAKP